MTTEARKAALDAILERIHLEGYEDYDSFGRRAANWFAEQEPDRIIEEDFVEEFSSNTDFFRYNQVPDTESFLGKVFSDVVDSINASPSSRPAQLYVEDIDSFSRAAKITPADIDVDLPLEIFEKDVKTYFREIIDEPFEQTDWGGERNDLFTNGVEVNGRRVDTAFMLKGPGVSGEMYISDAGTRGDQIQRLFDSPAELFIVQYNGKIEDRTVQHIKEQAQVTGSDMFCIIDGTDTARILKAYGKI